MARPTVIPPQLGNVPVELKSLPQWVVWKHWFHPKRKIWIKLPIDPRSEKAASTTNPDTWATFEEALDAFELFGGYDGVGFVFAENDGLVGIDIDKCIYDDDAISELAHKVLKQVPGFVERSPSGTGLHIITRADLPRAYKRDDIGLELYTSGRFFTITGVPL